MAIILLVVDDVQKQIVKLAVKKRISAPMS